MSKLFTLMVVMAVSLMGTHTAMAAGSKPEIRCSSSQPAKVELACGYRAFHRDSDTAHWLKNHRRDRVLQAAHQHSVGYFLWRERVDQRWIAQARQRLVFLSYPPHHALWMCEYSHEASTAPGHWHNQDTGGNGHYGGLQMHWNWGYGIVGDPANYSQLQQEWAAERGYQANGYSETWLLGQWDHPDCLAYR